MGKIRTRVIGDEQVEEKQKKEQKEKSAQKKLEKKAGKATSKATEALKAAEQKEKMENGEDGDTAATPKEATTSEAKEAKKEAKVVKIHVRGKKYKSAKKTLDQDKKYTVKSAVPLLKKAKFASFDESVELHLNVDEQALKGEVSLPHSTGKTVRVKIVDDKLLEEIQNGVIEFDILIAHPSYMAKLAKFARVLGPKGLMPNPKAGTVSPNPEEVAKKFEKGTLRWKTEPKFPLIHQMIGKISFEDAQLVENATAFLDSVGRAHIKGAFIKTTMSPSLKLDIDKS